MPHRMLPRVARGCLFAGIILSLLVGATFTIGAVPVSAAEAPPFPDTEFEYLKDLRSRKEPLPLINVPRMVVQPFFGLAVTVPWIWYAAKQEQGVPFFRGRTNQIIYLAVTPAIMTLGMSTVGWLFDRCNYNLFMSYGISLGMSSAAGLLAGGAGLLITAILLAEGNVLTQKGMNTVFIVGFNIGAFAGAIGGDFVAKILARRKKRFLRESLFTGSGDDVRLGFPMPTAGIQPVGARSVEGFMRLELVRYHF